MRDGKRQSRLKVLLPLAGVLVVLLLAFPSNKKFSYEYRKGAPWKYETLIAQFDFPVLKTSEQMLAEKEERKSQFVPYYRFSDDISVNCIKQVSMLSFGDYEDIKPIVTEALEKIYEVGVITDEGVQTENKGDGTSQTDQLVYIQRNKRVSSYPASELYRQSEARRKLLSEVSQKDIAESADSLLNAIGVYNLLVPNLIYDEQSTLLSRSDETISPTMGYVKAGSQIVSKGEIITAEIAQTLDSYKQEYDSSMGYSRNSLLFYLADLLLALMMVFLLYIAVYFSDKTVLREINRFLFILLIFVITSVSTLMIIRFGDESHLYLVPFTLAALLLNSFYDRSLSLSVYAVSLLPLLIFAHSGFVLYTIFLCGGAVSLFFFKYLSYGWRQFVLALIVAAVMCATYAGFRLMDLVFGNSYRSVLYLLISSALVICGYPLVFLFERMFVLVSNSRLGELADTSNSLLRKLEKKAPGTFQHSLQVANMADFVGRLVGANPMLLRAGALYHDIGKMNNPQCFVENQTVASGEGGSKYHSGLTPAQSAQEIVHHVTDGLDIALKNHVPEVIRDFILTHHGTSRVGYFYTQYLNDGGDPADDSAFVYKGKKPRTREQVILMVCDSVEAASRTLKQHTPEEYSDFVDKIVESKIAEGQLDNSDISIRELGILRAGLKKYLSQIYHERITYPKRNTNK